MKSIFIIFILLFSVSNAYADNNYFSWDKNNTALHIPLTVLFIGDLNQTIETTKHKELPETNDILGKYPSKSEVINYFIFSYIATTITVYILPPKYSYIFQSGVIVLEIVHINENNKVGLSTRLNF